MTNVKFGKGGLKNIPSSILKQAWPAINVSYLCGHLLVSTFTQLNHDWQIFSRMQNKSIIFCIFNNLAKIVPNIKGKLSKCDIDKNRGLGGKENRKNEVKMGVGCGIGETLSERTTCNCSENDLALQQTKCIKY